MRDLTTEERRILKVLMDPILWAEQNLTNPKDPSEPFKARWYQKELLDQRYKRKAIRMGRQTGKTTTLAVDALWYAFTHQNKLCEICAPEEKHVEKVFKEIEFLTRGQEHLLGSIKRWSRSRGNHSISLSNGSEIKGLTAGSSAGRKGVGTRGQSPSRLYLDEADYMDDRSIEAIMASIISDSDCSIWISSTPTGLRKYFYNVCTDPALGYHSYHYPSSVSPEWNEEVEEYFKLFYHSSVYQHEIEAEFGEADEGVFANHHIDKCIGSYHYADYELTDGGIRVMGVDWNASKVGTVICIVEYTPSNGIFTVIYTEIMKKKDFTQNRGVRRVIDLDKQYKCHAIYVDRGYGEKNIEDLHLYGMNNPASGMHQKVKGVDPSSTVDIQDPVTREITKLPIKPYMVNNACRVIEEHKLRVSKLEEKGRSGLIRQLRNFKIERIGIHGQFVYSKSNCHLLMALLLALYGFSNEFGNKDGFRKPITIIMNKQFRIGSYKPIDRTSAIDGGSSSIAMNTRKPLSALVNLGKYPHTVVPWSSRMNPWDDDPDKRFSPLRRGKVYVRRSKLPQRGYRSNF